MDTGNYAQFNEDMGIATIHYKDGTRSGVETIKVGDIIDAGTLIMARGWAFTAHTWNYSPLEGYTIGIERRV